MSENRCPSPTTVEPALRSMRASQSAAEQDVIIGQKIRISVVVIALRWPFKRDLIDTVVLHFPRHFARRPVRREYAPARECWSSRRMVAEIGTPQGCGGKPPSIISDLRCDDFWPMARPRHTWLAAWRAILVKASCNIR